MNVYSQLEFMYLSACPICAAPKETWTENAFDAISHGLHILYRHCTKCDVIFQNPAPTPESALEAYKNNSYREITQDGCGGASLGEAKLQALRADRIVTVIQDEKLVPRRLLDVGSSLGVLAYHAAKTFGCESWGQEPSKVFRDLAGGFEGTQFVETLDELEGQFDLITMIHVLEHLPDPIGQLRKLRELLTEDGTLIIECPDGRTTTGMSVWHYFVYTQDTLPSHIGNAGFEMCYAGSMREKYFNKARREEIPSLIAIIPKNPPPVPETLD